MPTYDYICRACDHAFEEFQSMSAKPLKKCPECGKQKLERLIGIGAGVIFKGSGFYETDYRSESYKKGAKADSDSKSESKSEDKSESKSEKKSDSSKKSETKPKVEKAKPSSD
jgi:putative FmdB family regulatory protein